MCFSKQEQINHYKTEVMIIAFMFVKLIMILLSNIYAIKVHLRTQARKLQSSNKTSNTSI